MYNIIIKQPGKIPVITNIDSDNINAAIMYVNGTDNVETVELESDSTRKVYALVDNMGAVKGLPFNCYISSQDMFGRPDALRLYGPVVFLCVSAGTGGTRDIPYSFPESDLAVYTDMLNPNGTVQKKLSEILNINLKRTDSKDMAISNVICWNPEKTRDLTRFVEAQNTITENGMTNFLNFAMNLSYGKAEFKETVACFFPSLKIVAQTDSDRFYSLPDRYNAIDYYNHPVLGQRLTECCYYLLKSTLATDNIDILIQIHKSISLFAAVTNCSIFKDVLAKMFDGVMDQNTVNSLHMVV